MTTEVVNLSSVAPDQWSHRLNHRWRLIHRRLLFHRKYSLSRVYMRSDLQIASVMVDKVVLGVGEASTCHCARRTMREPWMKLVVLRAGGIGGGVDDRLSDGGDAVGAVEDVQAFTVGSGGQPPAESFGVLNSVEIFR